MSAIEASSATSAVRHRWFRGVSAAALDLIFPPHCLGCDADLPEAVDDILLCSVCRRKLAPALSAVCRRCSAPLAMLSEADSCPHCRGRRYAWEKVITLARYSTELGPAVVQTKTKCGEPLAVALGRLLFAERAQALRALQAEVVVPVPLHWARRWKRGTSGPQLIAAVLAQRLGLPLRAGLLRRRRITPLQIDASAAQRLVVQRGSFRAGSRWRLGGQRVLLVDDVVTTGATAHEAARTLLAAGAGSVVVAALARGVGERAV